MSRQSDNAAARHSCMFSSQTLVRVFFTHFSTDGGRALPRANLAGRWFLGAVARETDESLWWRGVSGASVRKWFLSNTAKRPQETGCCYSVSQPREGWDPSTCFSRQVDLYLGIFILDCKAQSILCFIPTAISLRLLLRLESYTNACCKKLT